MANTQIDIFTNGTTTLATAGKFCDRNIDVNVDVPANGITPSGTKSITTNGSHDVTNYATAEVNVPTGITPSGSIEIAANGTHDVTNYASAVVNVPTAEENCVTRTLTVTQKGGTATTINTLITGDSFVKAHYADEGFFVQLVPITPVAATTGAIASIFHGNRKYSAHATAWTGHGMYWSSTTYCTAYQIATAVNGSTYQAGFRVNSSGNVVLYLSANRYLLAGDYQIVMGVAG